MSSSIADENLKCRVLPDEMLEVMPNLLLVPTSFDVGFFFSQGGQMKEYLGIINEDIIKKWHLDEHRNKQIVFYYDREEHRKEHLLQYANQNDYYYVMSNLKKIINHPDYVFYDVDKKD